MTDPLKTVFISYRLANSKQLAAYIDLYLRGHGYDVFRDVSSLDSGNFGQVILNQIAARTHFISILAPGTLERCSEPGDWVRRELEHAMHTGRNIVPVLAEGFTFGSNEAKTHLTGLLAHLTSYNALTLYYEYLDEGMDKLRTRFLQPPQVPVTITPVPAADALVAMREQAKAELQPAPTQAALTAEEYFNRGNERYDAGDYAGADADYSEAIRLKPDDALAYNNRGIARQAQGDLGGALADYEQALRLKPDFADAYNNRGAARADQGDLAGALADYNEALRLKPDYADAYYNRGNARQAQGDLAGASADYEQALRLKPDFASAYYNRGVARQAQGDLAGAIADYEQALRLKPDFALAYNNRGNARQAQGDLAGALADYEQALRLKPDDAEAYYNRGIMRKAQGDLAGALADYEQALRLKPDFASAYYNRAGVRKSQNDLAGAIADYQKYLDLGGGRRDGDQAQVEGWIAELRGKLGR
jgi:tetratricopeptide (TPR) repeat protein